MFEKEMKKAEQQKQIEGIIDYMDIIDVRIKELPSSKKKAGDQLDIILELEMSTVNGVSIRMDNESHDDAPSFEDAVPIAHVHFKFEHMDEYNSPLDSYHQNIVVDFYKCELQALLHLTRLNELPYTSRTFIPCFIPLEVDAKYKSKLAEIPMDSTCKAKIKEYLLTQTILERELGVAGT